MGAAVRQRELGAVERVDAAQDVAARVACFCVADVRRDLGELALVAGGHPHAHLQFRQPVGQVLANVGFHLFYLNFCLTAPVEQVSKQFKYLTSEIR